MHSCVRVNMLLCSVGILILGRVWKCMGEEQRVPYYSVRDWQVGWYTVQVSFYDLIEFASP